MFVSLSNSIQKALPVALALSLSAAAVLAHPDHAHTPGLTHEGDGAASEILIPGIGPMEADIDLKQLNVVIDAPWRIQIRQGRPNYIPVLYFFPETKKKWRQIQVTRMRLFEPGFEEEDPEILIWEDSLDAGPVFGNSSSLGFDGSKMVAVDGFGKTSRDLDLVQSSLEDGTPNRAWKVSEINDENRGWHIILRLPVPDSAVQWARKARKSSMGALGPGGFRRAQITLSAQVDYRRLGQNDDNIYTIKRKLFIDLDTDGFPTFEGWHYYDTHLHTAAEYDTSTSLTAVRKSYGGPIQMLKEAAYAIGLIEAPELAKNRVITTDHNVFYSDDELLKYGPSATGGWDDPIQVKHPEFTPYFTDHKGRVSLRGQREYENYLDHFGITTGEELTLFKRGGFLGLISGTLGSHLLSYSSRHFMGPFHGGHFLMYKMEKNKNPVDQVLASMASDPNFQHGFAYAAHPFAKSSIEKKLLLGWTDKQIEIALKGDFIRKEGGRNRGYIFKGFQGWNGKESRKIATNAILGNRNLAVLEDPTWHRQWIRGNPDWDDNLQFGLLQWHKYLAESFDVATRDAPDVRFVRKFYFSAGTDAHGDFNRDTGLLARGLTALPAQIMKFLKIFNISSNAFAKVRTYVDATGLAGGEKLTEEERALRAYARGQTILTDGPVLDFAMDANGNFDSTSETPAWHSDVKFEDRDGRIGGDGDMDGGRTMLVADDTEQVLFKYRWQGAPDFGGPLTRIEIYKDEAGREPKLVEVERNTGPAPMLEHQGQLNPDSPADSDGWRIEALGETRSADEPKEAAITAPSAWSLGGFTDRIAEPPYDFRCYTNPIWSVPVKLSKHVERSRDAAASSLPIGSVVITLRFPISMSAEAYEMRLVPLDEEGNSFGQGIALSPVQEANRVSGWSRNIRHGLSSAEFRVTNSEDAIDLTSTHSEGRFCVYLKGPKDGHGNRLNSIAWLVKL